jgi:hypothetical protein
LIFFSASLVSPFFTGRSNDLPTVGASIMSRQLASITLAAFLTAFAPVEIPTAQAKQRCAEAMPSNPQGHWWSYRLIDGRKCWYEGKPGLSKSSLEWPEEVSAQPASGEEIDGTVRAKPRNPVDSQAWAPNLQAWAVCTENLNSGVVVVKSAEDGRCFDTASRLNQARDWGIFVQ